MKRSFGLELLMITLLGCLYFFLHAPNLQPTPTISAFTNFLTDDSIRSIGLENERLAGAILPMRLGLQRYGHIPTWNSLLGNGVPITNNAFSYFFNPFHSLPILILGGVQGSKVATLIALLIAAYSMWTFGLAIGLGALPRVTIALLYMFNGSIAAKFGAGHFQLACSLAWPPLVLATLWWTLHSPKRIAPVAFGISFALLFYAGNIYYVLHTGLCCILIVAFYLVERTENHWHFRRDRLQHVLVAAAFAFGLCALQFFSIWQTRDFVTHEKQGFNTDFTLENNYDFAQAVNNIILSWNAWTYNHPPALYDAVDYAYVGNVVFVLIALAAIAYMLQRFIMKKQPSTGKRHARLIVLSLILALIMMIWAGGQLPIIAWLYLHIPLLSQFRFLGRALGIADLWWIVLAGIALDFLWTFVHDNFASKVAANGLRIAIRVVVIVGLFDSMTANLPALQFSTDNIPFDRIYADLRRAEPNDPFPSVNLPYSPYTFGAYDNEVRITNVNEGWAPAAPPKTTLLMNNFANYPRWLIAERGVDGVIRDQRTLNLIPAVGYEPRICYMVDEGALWLSSCSEQKRGYELFEYPQALHYAFLVSDADLTNNPATLRADQTQSVDIVNYRQDNIVIHAVDDLPDFYTHYLVVQESNFPGWQVTIDGTPVQTVTVPLLVYGSQTIGLIAIPTQKGDHTYTLTFNPPGFSTGIIVFSATLVLIVVYLTYRRKQKSPA